MRLILTAVAQAVGLCALIVLAQQAYPMSRTRQSAKIQASRRRPAGETLICNRSIGSPGVGVSVWRPYGCVGRTWASRSYGRVGLETRKVHHLSARSSCCVRFPWCIYDLFYFFLQIQTYIHIKSIVGSAGYASAYLAYPIAPPLCGRLSVLYASSELSIAKFKIAGY
jgi:hypothetical protein